MSTPNKFVLILPAERGEIPSLITPMTQELLDTLTEEQATCKASTKAMSIDIDAPQTFGSETPSDDVTVLNPEDAEELERNFKLIGAVWTVRKEGVFLKGEEKHSGEIFESFLIEMGDLVDAFDRAQPDDD